MSIFKSTDDVKGVSVIYANYFIVRNYFQKLIYYVFHIEACQKVSCFKAQTWSLLKYFVMKADFKN